MKSERSKTFIKNYKEYLTAISLVLIIIIGISPILKNFSNINTKDDYLSGFTCEYYSIKSILQFHQFPLWSPFLNGGYPIVGYPVTSTATPWIFLFLFFGEVEGIKISLILSIFIGTLGMFYLTKSVLKFNTPGSVFSSLLFSLCGINLTLLTEYWSHVIYSLYLLPLILATLIKSKEKKQFIIITSFLMFPVLSSGSIFFIIICLFLTIFSILSSISSKKEKFNFDLVKNLFIILVLTVLMSMFKILPMLQLLAKNRRTINDYNILAFYCIDFRTLLDLLVNPYRILRVATRLYFGYIPILFCLLSLIFYIKEMWKYGFILLIFIILTLGPNSPIDLLKLLWKVPLYHSIMAITEYSFPIVSFLISLLSGKFLQIIDDKKKYKMLKLILLMTSLISLSALFILYKSSLNNLFNCPKPELNAEKNFYQVMITPKNDFSKRSFLQYKNLLNNVGTINWNTDILLPTNVEHKFLQDSKNNFKLTLNPSYKGEAYFINPENKARISKVTSNLITVNVDIKTPDKLILNQNAFPGWRCNSGSIKNYNGLLSVDIFNKGKSIVVFKFMPRSFYIGLLISLISFEISILYLLKAKTYKM